MLILWPLTSQETGTRARSPILCVCQCAFLLGNRVSFFVFFFRLCFVPSGDLFQPIRKRVIGLAGVVVIDKGGFPRKSGEGGGDPLLAVFGESLGPCPSKCGEGGAALMTLGRRRYGDIAIGCSKRGKREQGNKGKTEGGRVGVRRMAPSAHIPRPVAICSLHLTFCFLLLPSPTSPVVPTVPRGPDPNGQRAELPPLFRSNSYSVTEGLHGFKYVGGTDVITLYPILHPIPRTTAEERTWKEDGERQARLQRAAGMAYVH